MTQESASLGPCSWPYEVTSILDVTLAGRDFWEVLSNAKKVGDVLFEIDGGERVLPAYATELDGHQVRFAADEVSNGVWMIASPDRDVLVGSSEQGE